ncbi:unnamed protein product [Arabis nemorensis]|uniref:Uncharacterized protein n=1 Tax=Arabis nemorensis TaxID=586526 RepID=A0A565CG32_9BRAS|nr:unnamed protein product [Arabis nemorensis]
MYADAATEEEDDATPLPLPTCMLTLLRRRRTMLPRSHSQSQREECKAILLVHDTTPHFLDGRVLFSKQAEPVMPVKDPTSDMAIISRKGSGLVRDIREKQSMHKSRQRFWELPGSNLGNILGVEKSPQQIDADTALVGDQGEVDFKGGARFAQHMKK